MKFYAPTKEPLALNATPLIDVVFLLLIFFMTSTTFLKETSLEVMLPGLHVLNAVPSHNTIKISVSDKGDFAVNDDVLPDASVDAISRSLTIAQVFDPNTIVLIAADAKAPYESVMRAMDAAGKLGYTKIQLQGNFKSND